MDHRKANEDHWGMMKRFGEPYLLEMSADRETGTTVIKNYC